MSDPRPRPEPVSGPVETGGFRSWTPRTVGSDSGPEWQAWSWTSGRRGFSWLGVLLVVLGVALLIQQLLPGVTFTSLLLAALAVAFAAAWLIGGWKGATLPALALGAWGARGSPGAGLPDRRRLDAAVRGPGADRRLGARPGPAGPPRVGAVGRSGARGLRRRRVTDVLPGGWDLLWPLLLVGLGVLLIALARRRSELIAAVWQVGQPSPSVRSMMRSTTPRSGSVVISRSSRQACAGVIAGR